MRYKISEIASINAKSLSKKDKLEFINYLDTANLTEGLLQDIKKLKPGMDPIPSRAQRKIKKNDILVSTVRPNQRHYGIIKEVLPNMIASTGFAVLTSDEQRVNANYLYFYLTQEKITAYLSQIAENSTSTYPSITPKVIGDLEIDLPPIEEQKFIAALLSSLSDKIELNNRINKTLEEMAQAIFKQWFVDFDFPEENGQPYKSSGGEMEESELGLIPKGWKVGCLGDITNNYDSKRIPLSKMEREKRLKIYPYYGAASLMDYVDDYLFDGIYVLMGEDGTVVDAKGYPQLQYVWGKFWVNNHAHVLQGSEQCSTEYIYLLLKNTNVSSIVTGAVQPKINQGNLNSIKTIIPSNDILVRFSKYITHFFSLYRNNCEQNINLSFARDSLLPKLMSGEIRVPVEEVPQSV